MPPAANGFITFRTVECPCMIYTSYPRAQYLHRKAEIDAAVARVMDGEMYILGREVAALEEEFATYCGSSYAVGVNSGTDALTLALMALDIKPGDEVITVSHTAVATVAAIERAQAVPVLVDVEADFYTLDPAALEAAITSKTRAVIPVHLYGQPADMDALMKIAKVHGIKVIEDCAQATGALYQGRRVGTIGDIGTFSFFPTKNLGCLGDGGMAVTDDAGLAERLRRLRQYGWGQDRVSTLPGMNSRLDEIQAAILRAKLPYLDEDNAARREIAASYNASLSDESLSLPAVRPECTHVFHLYVVQHSDRDGLRAHLTDKDIAAGIHYAEPAHHHPAYTSCAHSIGLPTTEALVDRILSLPMYPELDPAPVIDAIKSFAP